MNLSRENRVYRVRQLPLHLGDCDKAARFLAQIAPDLGKVDNIRVFSLAQEQKFKTATVTFRSLPSIFNNDRQQWTLQAELSERNIIVDIHFRGFTILNEPRHADHTTDCIAISGLASHPFGSWKYREPGSDFMWLRDRLPGDIPQLRSLIYGYDTKLFKSHSFQNLDDIARLLIASIKELRRSLPPAKSLLFLAHSLGGIILKRALVLLTYDSNDEEKTILKSISGLVFFGVPHRGMEISHFLAMVAKQPNEDLISRALSPNSSLLPELDQDFSQLASQVNLNIKFIYETAESQLTEQTATGTWVRSQTSYAVLVNKDSAVPPGTPPRDAIAIDEDHSNMVKFGEDDDVYRLIKTFLLDLTKDAGSQISVCSTPTHQPASQTSRLGPTDLDKDHTDPSPTRRGSCSTIPFLKDPEFVGREDILTQLDSGFADSKSQNWVSLYGLGGIGKSQIAIEYSYRRKGQSRQLHTFWVHASSKARFEQSYIEIATKVEMPGFGEGKVDILQMVSKWLLDENNGPWLLILDNADDATVLLTSDTGDGSFINFLPRVEHGLVLITTRDRSCALRLSGNRGMPIEVLPMTLDESVRLLRVWLPEAHQEEASELVQELERVPLAISQASAYIKELQLLSIPKYLTIFRHSNEDQAALLNKNKEDLRRDRRVPNAVITSWELSFDQIREKSPGSADLLSLMSYLNRQAIPQFLIEGADNEISFMEKMSPLLSFSLIRAEAVGAIFEIHRLVQIAMQHWLRSKSHDRIWKERAIERVKQLFPPAGVQRESWPACEALMSHAKEVISYTDGLRESELSRADILATTAWYLAERRGNYVLAHQRSRTALEVQRQYLPDDSESILNTLNILATVQGSIREPEKAIGIHEFVLKQRLKKHGPEHLKSLDTMHNLALSHVELGHYEKAEKLFEHRIKASRSILSMEDPQYLVSEDSLAWLYLRLGKYEEAEKLLTNSMAIHIRRNGFEHLGTLVTMTNLSNAYKQQKKFEKAEELIAKAIPSLTKVFGSGHCRTLDAMYILADMYFWLDKIDEAKDICVSSLDMAQRFLGNQSTVTLNHKSLLGNILCTKRIFVDASRVLKDVVTSSKEKLGVDHPETLTSMFNLAICYYDMGNKDHAIELMAKVVKKHKEVLPADHPGTSKSAVCLAKWKRQVGETEEGGNEEWNDDDEGNEEDREGVDEDEEEGRNEEGSDERNDDDVGNEEDIGAEDEDEDEGNDEEGSEEGGVKLM